MTTQNHIQLDIVSAEQAIFSGTASMVFAPAELGEIGIAPGHTAFMSTLQPGDVRARLDDGSEEVFYVSGGIIEVQPHMVTILSDTCIRAHDLDESAALEVQERAKQNLAERGAEFDYSQVLSELAQTAAQIRAIRRIRDKKS